MSLLTVLTLGLLLGIRHATDADHVVAVSTILTRERTTRAAVLVGALWGLGHTFTIVAVGGAIVVFGLVIPPRVGLSMELSVAVMLVVLGGMNLTGAFRMLGPRAHHDHANPVDSLHHGSARPTRWAKRLRPLLVGVIHGLAGSAALALLVLTTLHDAGEAVLYLGVFGVGTVIGMILLTAAVAVPVAAASRRFASFERWLAGVTGSASIAFGLLIAYEVGFVEGLFLW